MRSFFEEIQFIRGLAILDYVQGKRYLKKWRRMQDYKDFMKQSALKFAETHEIEGIQQCILDA